MGLRRRYPGMRALISIGGGGFDTSIWSAATGSAAARAKFVAGVAEWVARVDADGVDLDWEFPGAWRVTWRGVVWRGMERCGVVWRGVHGHVHGRVCGAEGGAACAPLRMTR